MNIALFAAVPEEVGALREKVNFTGIGRENATRAMVRFMNKFKDEDFLVLNIGTVGSHDRPVGSLLSISEIITAGAPFNAERMLLDHLSLTQNDIQTGVLYSSDCFVSPDVFSTRYLENIKSKADCFDMESSALYTIAHEYGKKYASFKIVSDNLDVTIEVWKERVGELSTILSAFVQQLTVEINKTEPIHFLKLED